MNTAPRNVLVIGSGLHGLVTAKTLLCDPESGFDRVTVFEKAWELGGVWSTSQIYDGLCTNSPLLTYEIPDFPYPDAVRRSGQHATAQEVNSYLRAYAQYFGVTKVIRFRHKVERIEWSREARGWKVMGTNANGGFLECFSHVVVCTGLYHNPRWPLIEDNGFTGKTYHSSQIGQEAVRVHLAASNKIVIVGAGKSAIDLATLLAQGKWAIPGDTSPDVYLVYRRPHWLSPRRIVRTLVPFERLLFSRFVNAWTPYYIHPDILHRAIAETSLGKMLSKAIFMAVGHDFVQSLRQSDLVQTIPDYPLSEALSGNLHVAPEEYLESVRQGRITVVKGTPKSMTYGNVNVETESGEIALEADNVVFATGYRTSLPLFSPKLLEEFGMVESRSKYFSTCDIPSLRLFRQIIPPQAAYGNLHPQEYSGRIAFNGFAYSLLNPTVAFVTAHWISDYFLGHIQQFKEDTDLGQLNTFQEWQRKSFGPHGDKGTHIGPHATLYTDELLHDMGLTTGHIRGGWARPSKVLQQWFRPMYPEIYRDLSLHRQARGTADIADRDIGKGKAVGDSSEPALFPVAVALLLLSAAMMPTLITWLQFR